MWAARLLSGNKLLFTLSMVRLTRKTYKLQYLQPPDVRMLACDLLCGSVQMCGCEDVQLELPTTVPEWSYAGARVRGRTGFGAIGVWEQGCL